MPPSMLEMAEDSQVQPMGRTHQTGCWTHGPNPLLSATGKWGSSTESLPIPASLQLQAASMDLAPPNPARTVGGACDGGFPSPPWGRERKPMPHVLLAVLVGSWSRAGWEPGRVPPLPPSPPLWPLTAGRRQA